MMTQRLLLTFGLWFLLLTGCHAQTITFTGAYSNASSTVGLQFKSVGNEYHGLLTTYQGNYPLKASAQGGSLSGQLYTANGPIRFTASFQNNGLTFQSDNYTDNFYRFSNQHYLQDVDLSAYMNSGGSNPSGNANPATGDYDYSYAQSSTGQATERYQRYPNANRPASPYPALNDREMLGLVAGAQLVIYNQTSILNSQSASSITYVNFCANGTFTMNYDGSFSVEGYTGANAQGASHGRNSGSWQLVTVQGKPAIYVAFNNGNSNFYYVNRQNLRQGRWRIGNKRYAMQRNKVRCR